MTPDDARRVLGIGPDATIGDAVIAHRRLQRRHHPDVAGVDDPLATARSAELNRALAVLRTVDGVPMDDVVHPPETPVDGAPDAVGIALVGDRLIVDAPADETYLRLLDAGVGLGGIGHLDPRLGLLELIVRFEGGPTCSVLLTLEGHNDRTEVLCEMESIEAAATPSIEPVLARLLESLLASAAHPPPAMPI